MRIIRYLGEHKGMVALIAALLLAQAVLELMLPNLTARLVDDGIMAAVLAGIELDAGFIAGMAAQMVAVTLAAACASAGNAFLTGRLGAGIGRDLRERLFARVTSFSDAEVQRFSAASLITRGTNDIQQVQLVCTTGIRMVLFSPIMAAGAIFMVVSTDARMGWVIVVAVAVVFAVVGVLLKAVMPKFRIMQQLIDRVNLVAREMITGQPVIRAFNRQAHEQERFEQANGELRATQLFANRAMALMAPTMMLVMNGVSVVIVWVAAGFIDAGTMETGQMIAFLTYSMHVIMSFLMLSVVFILLPRAEVAAARVDEVIGCEPSIRDAAVPRDGELGSAPGAQIAFDHVTFAYADDSEPAVRDVSFEVPAGGTLAIVGPTGSGKSTVLRLLLRSHDACEGRVLLDGIDVRDLTLHGLHAQVGYVPQTSFLFSGTIASNVAYADPGMPEERVRQAVRIAQAESIVDAKEEGLAAPVSQGGTNVSGGQRQRLAIARAIASDARVLLFDDSFSALDYATDAALRRALAEELSGRTVVIVAQRIATVRGADRIIVMDEGRVVGAGTHDELLATCAVYQEIARSQMAPDELGGGGAA